MEVFDYKAFKEFSRKAKKKRQYRVNQRGVMNALRPIFKNLKTLNYDFF